MGEREAQNKNWVGQFTTRDSPQLGSHKSSPRANATFARLQQTVLDGDQCRTNVQGQAWMGEASIYGEECRTAEGIVGRSLFNTQRPLEIGGSYVRIMVLHLNRM